jgi:hypothetical protein
MAMVSPDPVMIDELETSHTGASQLRELQTVSPVADPLDEFAGFVANPAAFRRGGAATQAVRGHQGRGLLQRMADAEVNRFWRAEIAVRETE